MGVVFSRLLVKLRQHWGVFVLFAAWLVIVFTNTESGTWFLSWDTMASEFNPALNIERSITGAWQSFQGLGLLGGHGYSAQLFHAVTQAILGIFIPLQYLRYAFAYLMLLSGAAGAYVLIIQTIRQLKLKVFSLSAFATLGGLVYILHPGTVQTFYVALEPFAVMYGVLPWALWSFGRLLEQRTARRVTQFFLINAYFSIIGFIPPLFITYGLFLGCIAGAAFFARPNRWATLHTSLLVALVVLVTNAYWLAPVAYFTLSQGDHYLFAKLNQITTTEFVYTTRSTGNFAEVALLEGFLFDSFDQPRTSGVETLELILSPWKSHLQSPMIRLMGYGIAAISLWGLLWSGLRAHKHRAANTGLVLAGVLTFALLLTDAWPFTYLSEVIRNIPVLNQAFRIPYSKLSMSASLFLSLWFTVGVAGLLELLPKKIPAVQRVLVAKSTIVVLALSVIVLSLPSFSGHFLYQGARVTLPPEYTQLMEFFAARPSYERIAVFPMYTYSGWDMHVWRGTRGYTGSGFLWYGMKQPILSRSFDVWSPFNETYRLEMQRAVYSQDTEQFARLLEKYRISHIVIDTSVFLPNADTELFFVTELQQMLDALPGVQPSLKMGNLVLYQTTELADTAPVRAINRGTYTTAPNLYSRFDPSIVGDGGTGITSAVQTGVRYPFAGIQQEIIPVQTDRNQLVILGEAASGTYSLRFPEFENGQYVGQLATISYTDAELVFTFDSPVTIETGSVRTELPILPAFSVPLESSPDSLTLEINGQVLTLSKNSTTKELITGLRFGEAVGINYFDTSIASASADHVLVDATELHTSTIPSVIWQTFRMPTTKLSIPQQEREVRLLFKHTQPNNQLLNLAPSKVVSCTTLDTGSRDKQVLNNSITYISTASATSCDALTLSGINNQTPGLLRITGENRSGRNIRAYVENLATNRVDFEHVMTTPQFDIWVTLPSWQNQPVSQYSLHFENRSYGRETAINQVRAIEVHPLPVSYEWLSQISLIPAQSEYTSEIAVESVQRWGTGLSVLTLNGESGIIAIHESSNSGWRAFTLSKPTVINAVYSMLTSQQLTKKVVLDNWAQGWAVPPQTTVVLIVHDAQLLLFGGLWLLLVSSFLFALKTLRFLSSNQ